MKLVKIYTDGACQGNPGPGGYGAVLVCGKNRKELSGGFRLTTNNRMELLAAIEAIGALTCPCKVELTSDSSYLVNAMNKGWLENWKKKRWKGIKNSDLWKRLDNTIDGHRVVWVWVKGHAGHFENERCDELAVSARKSGGLKIDNGYVNEL